MRKTRCSFGKEIEKRLIDMDQNKKWLIEEIKKDTGKYFDGAYLQKILTGELSPPTIFASICKILNLQGLGNDSIVVTNCENEIVAIVTNNEIIEKAGYKVTINRLT